MLENSDFKDLLRCLNHFHAKYLVIGGYAVIEYSEPRYTKDLDIWVKADKKNAALVYKALARFGAPVSMLSPDDFAEAGYFFQMGIAPSRIDILMSVKGLVFETAWKNKVEAVLFKTKVNLISRQDLIKAKLASKRPQDLIDAETLKQAKKATKPTRSIGKH